MKPHWWQTAVFYQIYPRSFADGNGDGIGDIGGMIDRLDYLQDLGIDAVWLSPHYPSPLFDCGYDVADYTGVAPEYGTLDDFKKFLAGAHRRGIRVILDLVLNHTSHLHPWFLESRSGRSHPKRNWYVWRSGNGGGPPNNWLSVFGGSAWERDAATGEYYYHFFFKEQPDLNWRNPEVKKAMFDAVRFWLELGVDGFRLDAIGTIFENPAEPPHTATQTEIELHRMARQAKTEAEWKAIGEQWRLMYEHQADRPELHELMQELRALVDQYPCAVLVGETEDIAYHGNGHDELHMVFNFTLMKTPRLTPAWVRENQTSRLTALPDGAWPCNTLGNHDSSRVYNRYGDGRNDDTLARISLALMLTLKGTPFLYNGEEIGMTDLMLNDLGKFKDNAGVWAHTIETEHPGTPPAEALDVAAKATRDRCRTPLQWANAPNAGFCPAHVRPWLPVHPNYADGVNVSDEDGRPDSMLNFYRRMLRLRRQTPALVTGDYQPVDEASGDILAFMRRATDGQACLVALNMSERARRLSTGLGGRIECLYSTHESRAAENAIGMIRLRPFEIYIGVPLSPERGRGSGGGGHSVRHPNGHPHPTPLPPWAGEGDIHQA